MPKYLKDITHLLTRDDVDFMLANTHSQRDRALIACLYLTGGRPIEIISLRGRDLNTTNNEYFTVTLPTAKLGQRASFAITERTLEIPYTAPYADEFLTHAKDLPPTARFFPFNTSRVRQIVYKASDNEYCPYHFRHTRLTNLSRAGATTDELMYWKGALDTKSVGKYLAGKPIGRQLNIT